MSGASGARIFEFLGKVLQGGPGATLAATIERTEVPGREKLKSRSGAPRDQHPPHNSVSRVTEDLSVCASTGSAELDKKEYPRDM